MDSWIKVEVSSFSEARCLFNSATSWLVVTPTEAGVVSAARAIVSGLLATLVRVAGCEDVVLLDCLVMISFGASSQCRSSYMGPFFVCVLDL